MNVLKDSKVQLAKKKVRLKRNIRWNLWRWLYRITKIFIFLFILNLANPCDSSPCKNGATCQSVNDTFSCECAEGFEGKTCEEKGTIKYRFSFEFIITNKCI